MILRLALLVLMVAPAVAQVDVLTRRYDNLRSGVNEHETILNHANVRTHFGKLWTLFADAKIMAQPLYVANLAVPAASIIGSTAKVKCSTGCNAVIFATMKGTLYAYMADQKPTTDNDTLLWATYLSDGQHCKCGATGPQNGSGNFDMWAVDDPWWAILSTPVIDRASNSLYVVNWTNDQQYRVYNLSVTTGQIQNGPVVVQGSVGGHTFALNTNDWIQRRKQRSGLLLSNGFLYVAFGGDNPDGLAGWLFIYNASTLALKTVWSPTPSGRNGGIWMSGEAPAADAAGMSTCKRVMAISFPRTRVLPTASSSFVCRTAQFLSMGFLRPAIRCCLSNATSIRDHRAPCFSMIWSWAAEKTASYFPCEGTRWLAITQGHFLLPLRRACRTCRIAAMARIWFRNGRQPWDTYMAHR